MVRSGPGDVAFAEGNQRPPSNDGLDFTARQAPLGQAEQPARLALASRAQAAWPIAWAEQEWRAQRGLPRALLVQCLKEPARQGC
jgi:hypothetical protein